MSIYEVRNYGAQGNGEALDTAPIQAAIDACHQAGGGVVTISGGMHCPIGTVVLKSGICLNLEHGSRLIASAKREDYGQVAVAGEYGGNQGGFMLYAEDASDIALVGSGTIDGRGRMFMDGWWTEDGPYICKPKVWRPRGIGLFGCRQVTLRDFTFKDAAQWTIHLTGCNDVSIDGIRILNGLDIPNCDGIDPDHCRNVRIANCHIEAGDDCIVIKNTKNYASYGPTENIVVDNCTLISTSAALKIGTESHGDFRNIIFRGCTIDRSHRGLAIQLRDWGNVEDVLFSDMVVRTRIFHRKWWGSGEPIYVTAVPRREGEKVGSIHNVRFRNILCHSENGAFLSGGNGAPLQHLLLDAVRIELSKSSKWPGGWHDRRPRFGQEHGGLERKQTNGFYIAHARDVTLRGCEVAWDRSCDETAAHALYTQNVLGLRKLDFHGPSSDPARYAAEAHY